MSSPEEPDSVPPYTPTTTHLLLASEPINHYGSTSEPSVPPYTPLDPSITLTDSVSALLSQASAAKLTLPITHYGVSTPLSDPPSLEHQIITSFYTAIHQSNDTLVRLFISQGLVSPDVPNSRGETSLIAAIAAGNGPMVCTLVALGASVDLPARYDDDPDYEGNIPLQSQIGFYRLALERREFPDRLRTPLMVACVKGNLALVKLLVQDFKADDGFIAPDGQLALRLAADGGFREIVEYLPSRRGGEWRRWKVHHHVAIRRIKKAGMKLWGFVKFILWDLPKFFVWSCPKHLVVLPVKKVSVWGWENKKYFGGWCKRQVKEFPGRVKRGADGVGRGVKKIGRGLRKVPGLVVRLVKWLLGVVKRIPGAMKIVAVWIWKSLKKIGIAVGDVFLKVVSAVHTAVMAVLNFFGRIKIKDVWNGVCHVLRAVFVELPRAIWEGMKAFGEVSYHALEKLFGCIGEVLWFLCVLLFLGVVYAPKQLWKIVAAIGSSIAKGYHEIMVWFNPKH